MGIGYSLPGAAMTQYPGYVFDSNASWSGYGVNGLTNSTQEIRRHLAGEAESKSIYGNIFFSVLLYEFVLERKQKNDLFTLI